MTSSVAVADGRVFFSSYQGTFYAVDVHGKLLWKAHFGSDVPRSYDNQAGEHSPTYHGEFILSSPAVLNHTVVVGSGDGLVYAFDAQSGTPRWKFSTQGRVRSSSAVNNGIVYVASYDGSLYAIDFNSGRQVWRYDSKGRSLNSSDFGFDRRSILSSPALGDGIVYVGSRDSHLYAVDAAKGMLRWSYDYENNDNMTWAISSPAIRGEVVYLGTADGHFVHALRAGNGQELWRFEMPDRVWSSPAVAGSLLYISLLYITNHSGSLYAVDRNSGKENWHFRTRASIQSSPAVADGVVYFGSNDGEVYALRIDGPQPLDRAVYWDTETVKIMAHSDLGARYEDYARVRDFLHALGYDVLGPASLTDWLNQRISDHIPSVVVFPTDILPENIGGPDPAGGLFRQYLDSGGKVVWTGFPPMLLQLIVEKGTLTDAKIRWNDATRLLGISFKGALNNELGDNQVTPAGRDWGLPEWWLGAWDLPISNDVTALSLDDRGFAGAWVKSYGGPAGTGFVYTGIENWNTEMMYCLAMVAEYRPR